MRDFALALNIFLFIARDILEDDCIIIVQSV